MVARDPRPHYRLSAAGRAAVRRHHRREHRPLRARSRPGAPSSPRPRRPACTSMILRLPDGYETQHREAAACCRPASASASRWRARSIREPVPGRAGRAQLQPRRRGRGARCDAIAAPERAAAIAVVIAHRPSAIAAVDLILVVREGEAAAFGPKEEVLAKTVQNARQILARPAQRADARILQGAD